MPERPRNHVVRAMLNRRSGAHQRSRSGERQEEQALIDAELTEWQQEQTEETGPSGDQK